MGDEGVEAGAESQRHDNDNDRQGGPERAGPMGARGDSATATAMASPAPMTTAATMPINPSPTVVTGPAPSARRTATSSAPAPSWRPIISPAMSRTAAAAMKPETAR